MLYEDYEDSLMCLFMIHTSIILLHNIELHVSHSVIWMKSDLHPLVEKIMDVKRMLVYVE